MEKTKTNVVSVLVQAGFWLTGAAVMLAGFGIAAMAGIDAWQALTGQEGYGRMTESEMTAYGISTVGATLLILALTVAALVGLVAFWCYLKNEKMV